MGESVISDWKTELEELRAQTDAFAHKVAKIAIPMALPAIPSPSHAGGVASQALSSGLARSEREDISERFEHFRAHQRRFAREREDFANSLIARMRRTEQ